jgi:hypothetical protein
VCGTATVKESDLNSVKDGEAINVVFVYSGAYNHGQSRNIKLVKLTAENGKTTFNGMYEGQSLSFVCLKMKDDEISGTYTSTSPYDIGTFTFTCNAKK